MDEVCILPEIIEIEDNDPLEIKDTESEIVKNNDENSKIQKDENTTTMETSSDDTPGPSGDLDKPAIVEIIDDTSDSSSTTDFPILKPVITEPEDEPSLAPTATSATKTSPDIMELTDPSGDNFEVEFVESSEDAPSESEKHTSDNTHSHHHEEVLEEVDNITEKADKPIEEVENNTEDKSSEEPKGDTKVSDTLPEEVEDTAEASENAKGNLNKCTDGIYVTEKYEKSSEVKTITHKLKETSEVKNALKSDKFKSDNFINIVEKESDAKDALYHPVKNKNELELPETPSCSIENEIAALENSPDGKTSDMVDEQLTPVNGVDDALNITHCNAEAAGTDDATSSKVQKLKTDIRKTLSKEERPMKLPSHLIGHNLEKPVDSVKNGRVAVKPRLGVKVPYRNLSSQIVSKQEITDEIMERSRQRQAAADPPTGSVLFAKKLTNRLARKLSPTNKMSIPSEGTMPIVATASVPLPPIPPSSDRIANNSDLIALLEGDDDTDWNLISTKKQPVKNADWERETALKQLQELPKLGKRDSDDEPRFSLNPVTKTYTRKRKTSDDLKAILEAAKKPSLSTHSSKSTSGVTPTKPSSGQTPNITKSTVPPLKPISVGSPKPTQTTHKAPDMPKVVLIQHKTPLIQKTSSKLPTTQKSKSVDQKQDMKTPQKQSGPKEVTEQRPSSTSTVQKPKPSEQKDASNISQKPSVLKSTVDEIKSPPPGQKSVLAQRQPLAGQKTPVEQKFVVSTKMPISKPSIQKSIQNIRNLPLVEGTSPPMLPPHAKLSSDRKAIIILSSPTFEEDENTRVDTDQSTVEVGTPVVNKQALLSPNTYISKSLRVIKRKKIWDPDDDIVTTPAKIIKSPVTPQPEKKITQIEKKVMVAEKKTTPVEKKFMFLDKKPITIEKTPMPVDKKIEKQAAKKIIKKAIMKKKKPKRLTEIDRLLMDEGAVNLLYSVKNTEPLKKRNKSVISIDRAERELLNRTNEIKHDLLQSNKVTDTPIANALRKKVIAKAVFKDPAAIILHRKKSKDSVEESSHVHTPPASPAYAFHENVSRIIRRHSSSSFTSKESEDDESTDEKVHKKKKAERQRKMSNVSLENTVTSIKVVDDSKYSEFQTFNVRKFDNMVQIILVPTSPNANITLTLEVLRELTEILDLLQVDSDCRVVVVSSAGNSFCLGIDYKELASTNVKERNSIAKQYANSVREFLLALSKFTKLIVAGVHGHAIGLGVTMLPLFDMVLASDTATFSTPYTRLGCAAEGGVLLKLPHVMHNALASELFFASRKLTAAEGLRLGLVTRTLWPDKFQEELLTSLKVISGQSLQSMEAIKKQLRHQLLMSVEPALKSESNILIQHWTSSECQINFASYSFEIK